MSGLDRGRPGGDLHVVLGASGGIGRAVVTELVRRGHRVRAVHRTTGPGGDPRVERLAADVATVDGARAACAGAAVVHHCAQPAYHRWAQEFPAMNEAVIAGAAAAGAKVVFADNLYMYAPPDGGPLTEDAPQRPTSRKGAVRKALADRLLDAHRAGTVRVAIGRASDYYGPGAPGSAVGISVLPAVLAGTTVRWPGDPDVPRTLHHVDDIARGLAVLAEDDRADGRAWILPAAPPLTARQFAERVGAAAGRPARITGTPRRMLQLIGLFNRGAAELPDIWYQFDRPWVASDRRFQETFGPAPATPYDRGVADTVAWYRRRAGDAADAAAARRTA